MKKNVEKILQYVQKPARYAGGDRKLICDMPFAFPIFMKSV